MRKRLSEKFLMENLLMIFVQEPSEQEEEKKEGENEEQNG